MASLYIRKRSPYFWLKFNDKNGKVRQISTKCRVGVSTEVRRARVMAAEKSLEEIKLPERAEQQDWTWVDPFLKTKYKFSPATLERFVCAWPTITLFLQEKKILSPAHLLRKHCFDYTAWRQTPDKKNGKYAACHNTALLELKILRIVMQEAVERELCTGNPCVCLGISKQPRKLKPELTTEDYDFIKSKMKAVEDPVIREMLSNSFEIAWYQGCRLKETQLNPQADVDLKQGTISFKAKGGKTFTTALHPKLLPLFTRLKTEGRTSTWHPPANSPRQWASAKWFKFLDEHGIKAKLGGAVCFHSTRVTVVTRLARAEVPISKAKSYVGHASSLIHDTYQRLRPDDLAGCTQAIT